MSGWDDARETYVRKRWIEGASASEIAREMACGLTSNAIIGKVHRLGISRDENSVKMTRSAAGRMGATAQRAAVKRAEAHATASERSIVQTRLSARSAVMDAPTAKASPVTLMDLRDSMCRWPLGDPAEPSFRFCGATIPVECGPYCQTHRKIAYRPAPPRQNASKDDLRKEAAAAI